MKGLLLGFGLCSILAFTGCRIDGGFNDTNFVNSARVKYEDTIIQLTRSQVSFEEIVEEGLRIVTAIDKQDIWITDDVLFEQEFPRAKYVDLVFSEPVTLTTECKIPERERNGYETDAEGYLRLPISSFVRIILRGVEVDGRQWKGVLLATGPWGPEKTFHLSPKQSKRGHAKLERLVDNLKRL